MKYSAKVAAAIRDYKEKPSMMRVPKKPELSALIADGTLLSNDTIVPDNLMDVYKEKMKVYARTELKFEADCESAYSLVIGQCSLKMIQ